MIQTRGSKNPETMQAASNYPGLPFIINNFMNPKMYGRFRKPLRKPYPPMYCVKFERILEDVDENEKNGKKVVKMVDEEEEEPEEVKKGVEGVEDDEDEKKRVVWKESIEVPYFNFYVNDLNQEKIKIEIAIRNRMVPWLCRHVTKRSQIYTDPNPNTYFIMIDMLRREVEPDKVKLSTRFVGSYEKKESYVYSFMWKGENEKVLPTLCNKWWNYDEKKDKFGFLYRMVTYSMRLEYVKEQQRLWIMFDYHIFKYSRERKRWTLQ